MVDDDAADQRVERLLEQILESGETPEEACRACPELLPEVRAGLRQLRQLEEDVSACSRRPTTVTSAAGVPVPGRTAGRARLRGAGPPRPRRDGDRLPGATPAAQPPGRAEDDPRRHVRAAVAAAAVPARGRGGRRHQPPEHRAGVQRRRVGRPALVHDGAGRRRQPGPRRSPASPQPARESAALVAAVAEAVAGRPRATASSTATSSRPTSC